MIHQYKVNHGYVHYSKDMDIPHQFVTKGITSYQRPLMSWHQDFLKSLEVFIFLHDIFMDAVKRAILKVFHQSRH